MKSTHAAQSPLIQESFFDEDMFLQYGGSSSSCNGERWNRCLDYSEIDQNLKIFSGRFFQKHIKSKKWLSFHFELFSDRLIRVDRSTHKPVVCNDVTSCDCAVIDQLPLSSCQLKKIKYSETSYASYKYGIRLQKGEAKTELFTENAENFTKLYCEIKRFCVLPKFPKKFKVLAKIKSSGGGMAPSKATAAAAAAAPYYKCCRYSDSMLFCVRVIDLYQLTESQQRQILQETAILRRLDHPSILRLCEAYEDDSSVQIIYELITGKDMKSKSLDMLTLDEKSISDLLWKLLQAVNYLHKRGIVHRDIRLENIAFREPHNYSDLCLINFISADYINAPLACQPLSFIKHSTKKPQLGMPGYIAPEYLSKPAVNTVSEKMDIFALGVVFYFLVFGRMPMEGRSAEETMKLNEKCEIDFTPATTYGKFTSSSIDLMKKMLEKDPKKRADADTLIRHVWFINMRNRTTAAAVSIGEDARQNSGNNLSNDGGDNQLHTLTTIAENTEYTDMLSSACQRIDNRTIKQERRGEGSRSGQQPQRRPSSSSKVKATERFSVCTDFDTYFTQLQPPTTTTTTYMHTATRDGSLEYEDEFENETVEGMMLNLNHIKFLKVPSKVRHDSLHFQLVERLGMTMTEICKNAKTMEEAEEDDEEIEEEEEDEEEGERLSSLEFEGAGDASVIGQGQPSVASSAQIHNQIGKTPSSATSLNNHLFSTQANSLLQFHEEDFLYRQNLAKSSFN